MIKNNIFLITLILLGLIPLFDLFQPGLPITHDGQDHVARIANFYQNLTEGNIIPRWAGNLNWGFGHPILMFLYPLPSYSASFFHFLGFNLVDSIKIVFGASFILSGIFMYVWLKNFLPIWASFTGGLLYMFAPYRFVDLYVRGALGEHVAFMFLPLVLYFLLKISKEKTINFLLFAGGAISIAGLILSHNAISLMFMPIVLIYALYLIWSSKKLFTIYLGFLAASSAYLLFTIFLGLGISAFFWIPAFFEGKYTLRDIVTAKDYASRFVEFKDLLYGEWNYGISGQFSVQIGIVHWLVAIFAVFVNLIQYKKKNKLWILTFGSFIIFLLTIFLMHSSSKFIWDNITTLQKFQFPWRLLSITVFITSLLGAIALSQFNKTYKTSISIFLIFLILFLNKDYWHVKGYLLKPESFYTDIYNSTTDTGESSPIWSVRFMEKRPKAHIEIISGNAEVKEIKRTSTYHQYEVKVATKTRFRENTLYFPGWNVFVDGQKASLEFQDPRHRGLITFFVDKGEHIINLSFSETKLRFFANAISLISIIILGSILILPKTLRLK